MSAETLLARLDRARRAGDGRWTARCPAHEDKSPSLSIRELPDGRVLVHCFGGCPVASIVGAVGLSFADLMPPRSEADRSPRERRAWSDGQLVEIIGRETCVIFVAAADVTLKGRALSEPDLARLRKAQERLSAVLGAAWA